MLATATSKIGLKKKCRLLFCLTLSCIMIFSSLSIAAQEIKCNPDRRSDRELATCLLSARYYDPNSRDTTYLSFFAPTLFSLLDSRRRIGGVLQEGITGRTRLEITTKVSRNLRKLLIQSNIRQSDILPSQLGARSLEYFVIHDVTPIGKAHMYTPGRVFSPTHEQFFDELVTTEEDLLTWRFGGRLHVYVNRSGASLTNSNPSLARTVLSTRISTYFDPSKVLHVGLLSALRRLDIEAWNSEEIKRKSIFTKAQMDRLALIYVAASVQAGQWLVPAFHSNIESYPKCPTNFDLELWDQSLRGTIDKLEEELRTDYVEEKLEVVLNQSRLDLEQLVQLIPPMRESPASAAEGSLYSARKVRNSFLLNKMNLVNRLGDYMELSGMKDYVEKFFPVPSVRTMSNGGDSDKARRFVKVKNVLGASQEEEVDSSFVQAALRRAYRFYERLTRSKSAVNIRVVSTPASATVVLRTSRGIVRQIDTNSTFTNVFRGLYLLEISKEGYLSGNRPLDLVNEEGQTLTCTLGTRAKSFCVLR